MRRIEVEVNNKTKSPMADDFFVTVAEKTIAESDLDLLAGGKNISISVALVSEKEMQELNKQCRQKDSVTDILSFWEYSSIEEIENVMKNSPTEGLFLGELILCYDDIVKYAKKEKIELREELANVFSHGILHLLGFEHGSEMFAIQNKIKKQ